MSYAQRLPDDLVTILRARRAEGDDALGQEMSRLRSLGWGQNAMARAVSLPNQRASELVRVARGLPRRRIKPITHGTVVGYMAGKCRCDLCRDAQNAYARERHARVGRSDRRKPVAVPDPMHELADKHKQSGVAYHSNCKCAHCRDGKRLYLRARREAVKSGAAEVARHGAGGYTQGCRCDVCRAAVTERMRQRRAA